MGIVQRHTFLQFGLVWFMTTGYELQIAGVEKIFFMSDGLKVSDGLGVAEPTFLNRFEQIDVYTAYKLESRKRNESDLVGGKWKMRLQVLDHTLCAFIHLSII